MKNPLLSIRSWFKKPQQTTKKAGNRRLSPTEMEAQRQRLQERKDREATRLKAQKSISPNAPRNRPKHQADNEKAAKKKSWWPFRTNRKSDPKKREQRRQKHSITPLIGDLLSGEFLTREGVTRHIPYLLFISGLFIAYIAMGYQFERMERAKIQNKRQLQELSAEYKTIKAQFETQLQQSRVEESIANIGLSQPVEPPFLLEQKSTRP
tara:strand:+ start:298 stop:924 length:627 start_codon:yes stop_codon:yes gene_type:complete